MYDHYIALDWAQRNMAFARMTAKSNEIKAVDVPSDLGNAKDYLKNLRGKKILCIEETTTAHWLYTELSPHVDKIIVCDPYRNKLLSEGAKNDIIDAKKLVMLLKADLLKPIFHGNDECMSLRKVISAYDDLIKRGVRLKNQKSALLRAIGKEKNASFEKNEVEDIVLDCLVKSIDQYEEQKKNYKEYFEKKAKNLKPIRLLDEIPGIGPIGATKIYAIIIDTARFAHVNNYLAYCGLVRLDKMSGGRSYGSKMPRHRRDLKAVFKTAALSAITNETEYKKYYTYLIKRKKYPEFKARHAVARKISIAAFGVLNNRQKYDPNKIGALKALK